MKRSKFAIILIAILNVLLYSCKTKYVPVETKYVETIEIHDTTVVRNLEVYKDSTSLPDTVSFLSNSYAYSWAKYSGGMLQHSLGIWPNAFLIIEIPMYKTITKTIETPKIVEVEKKLKKLDQIKIDYFVPLLLSVFVLVFIIIALLKRR